MLPAVGRLIPTDGTRPGPYPVEEEAMRTSGLCLALLATANLVALSTPAFAQGDQNDSWPTRKAFVDPGTAPANPPESTTGTVMVHVNSTTPVTLQHRTNDTQQWETLCTSPCDVRAPIGDQYQIVGDNVNASKPFALDPSAGDTVTLDVRASGKNDKTIGYVVAGGGAALFIAVLV